MENWEIPGPAATADSTLKDYMVSVMESSFYFENHAFGSTLKEYADSFEIDAYYAAEDDDSGFCPIREDDAIVEITVSIDEVTCCLGFVFDSEEEYGVFSLCYAHDGETPFDDPEAAMSVLEPYFADAELSSLIDFVMTSSYYFDGLPFGETIRQCADEFTIEAGFAEEDSDAGMCSVAEGEGLVMIEAVAAGQRFYMEFVFKAEDDYGTFYMCYGEVDEEPVEDFDEFIAALEPFFE